MNLAIQVNFKSLIVFLLSYIPPDRVVCGAEVDEEVPGPVGHFEKVLHAAQVHSQQAGPAPDGGHPPGSHPDVRILSGQRQDLFVEIVGPLGRWTLQQGRL